MTKPYLGWVGINGDDGAGVSRCQPIGYGYTGSIYNGTGHASRLFENDGSRLELSPAYSGGSYVAELQPYARISSTQRASLKKLTVDYDGHLRVAPPRSRCGSTTTRLAPGRRSMGR